MKNPAHCICGIFAGFEINFLLVGDSKAVWGRGKCTQQENVPTFGMGWVAGVEVPSPAGAAGTGNIHREQTQQALVVWLNHQGRSHAWAVS